MKRIIIHFGAAAFLLLTVALVATGSLGEEPLRLVMGGKSEVKAVAQPVSEGVYEDYTIGQGIRLVATGMTRPSIIKDTAIVFSYDGSVLFDQKRRPELIEALGNGEAAVALKLPNGNHVVYESVGSKPTSGLAAHKAQIQIGRALAALNSANAESYSLVSTKRNLFPSESRTGKLIRWSTVQARYEPSVTE